MVKTLYLKPQIKTYLESFEQPIDETINQLLDNVDYRYIRYSHCKLNEVVTIPVDVEIYNEQYNTLTINKDTFIKKFLEFCFANNVDPNSTDYSCDAYNKQLQQNKVLNKLSYNGKRKNGGFLLKELKHKGILK